MIKTILGMVCTGIWIRTFITIFEVFGPGYPTHQYNPEDGTLEEIYPDDNPESEDLEEEEPLVTPGDVANYRGIQWKLDVPEQNSVVLPDQATASSVEAIHMLNDHILFVIIQSIFCVFWLVAVVLTHYHQWVLSDTTHFYDDSLLEASWTTIPGIILYTILSPSLDVLYFFEDPYVPEITVKAVGHQWYWHYELSDIKTC